MSSPLPYDEVGHYRVLRPLGHGAMGTVLLARDTRLGRLVALKVISSTLLADDDDARARFDVEARTTASLSHPNVVTLYDVGEHEGHPWVALEYVEGSTLSERMRHDWPSVSESVRIALALARAIEAAHAAGIVHRDLKPANVILGKDGRPRVVDFGIARFVGKTTERSSLGPDGDGSVEIAGTPTYMAPEQWQGSDEPATDVWAVGLVLRELLTKSHPFRGFEAMRIMATLLDPLPFETPPELVEAAPDVAPIVMRCLAKDPKLRPTAAELVADLEALEGRQRRGRSSENPFRGLLAFSERHSQHFFGRSAEVDAFVERLRDRAALVVVGTSGAGKSSFLFAGVIPRLRESGPYHVVVVRPQAHPLRALAEAVVEGVSQVKSSSGEDTVVDVPAPRVAPPWSADELEGRLAAHPELLAVVLADMANKAGERVLLVVDQLEEICTMGASDDEARAFVAALGAAGAQASEPVRVVMTVRDDFLSRIPWGERGRAMLAGVVLLAAPEPEQLREIVGAPLAQTGHAFDDPLLLDEMIAAVRGESACLPLLQFTMSLLWIRRDERSRLLLRDVYDAMGGVGGALASHAESVLAALEPAQVDLCRQLFLRLVTTDGTRKTTSRAELVHGLQEAEALVDRLLEARLLSQPRGDEGRVELAHESLTRVWRRLARWIEEGHEDVALANDLAAAAERWERRGRRDDELWQGDPLRDARRLVARGSVRLGPVAHALVEGSVARERVLLGRRRALRVLLFGAAIVTAVTSTVAAWALHERQKSATVAAHAAERDRAVLLEERALASYASGDVHAARAQLRTAIALRDSLALRNLARRLEADPSAFYLSDPSTMYDAKVLPGGATIAVASQSGAVEIVDATTLERRSLLGHGDQVLGVALTEEGSLVTASWNGEVRRWARGSDTSRVVAKRRSVYGIAARGTLVAATYDGGVLLLEGNDDVREVTLAVTRPMGVTLSRDATKVYVGGSDGRLIVVDVAARTAVRASEGGAAVQRIVEDPVRGRVFATRADGTLTMYDKSDLTRRWQTAAHAGEARGVTVLADGRVVTGGSDRRIVVWDPERQTRVGELPARLGVVTSLALSDDGELLVAAGTSGIEGLRVSRVAEVQAARAHVDPVVHLQFSDDGSALASASTKSVVVWDVAKGAPTVTVPREDRRGRDIAFDRARGILYVTDERGGIAIYSLPGGRLTGTFGSEPTSPFSLAYDPAHDRIAVGTTDGRVLVYRVSSRAKLSAVQHHTRGVRGVAFSPDGAAVYSAGMDGKLVSVDVASGKIKTIMDGKHELYGLAIDARGARIVVTSLDGAAFVVDPGTGAVRDLGTFPGRLYRPAISPDGARVALPCSDGKAYLVEVEGGARSPLVGHRAEVNVAAFSPDGALLATGGDDRTVRVFDVATHSPRWGAGAAKSEHELTTDPAATRTLPLADGSLTAAKSGRVELHRGAEIRVLRGTPAHPLLLAIDAGTSLVALGFEDGSFGLWDTTSGAVLERGDLHGPIVALRPTEGGVEVKSELGGVALLATRVFAEDYCTFARGVWRAIPFEWRDGKVVPAREPGACVPP